MPKLTFNPALLSISSKLLELLNQVYTKQLESNADLPTSNYLVFSFRDTSYSADAGGFHPVEIAICRTADNTWSIEYITDFAYMGNHYPELERNLDFDFRTKQFFVSYQGWKPMKEQQAPRDLYQLWESNFLTFVDIDAFDEIKVTAQ